MEEYEEDNRSEDSFNEPVDWGDEPELDVETKESKQEFAVLTGAKPFCMDFKFVIVTLATASLAAASCCICCILAALSNYLAKFEQLCSALLA